MAKKKSKKIKSKQAPPKEIRRFPRRIILGVLLILIVFLAFLPAVKSGFIWDDDTFLTENSLIKASDGLQRFWFTTEPPDYFPLTSTTLWIEWRLWGANPTGYHVVNILLHCVTGLLIWLVLKELGIPGAWVAALVFGIHPVNVESVAWITERKNTLPMVFYTATILMFLKFENSGRRKWYVLSLACFLLALLSKTSVVMLPFVLGFCLWWRRGKITTRDLYKLAPFFSLSAAFGLITTWFQYTRAIGSDVVREDGFLSRLAGAGWAVWFYLYKALLPIRLNFVYPRWEINPSSPLVYVPDVLILIAMGIFWHKRKSWGHPFLFAFGYYILTLLPVLGFLNIYFMKYSLVADHWQYISLVGVVALAVGVVANLYEKKKNTYGQYITGLAVCLILVLFSLTYFRTQAYKDVETLWRDTLSKNPGAGLAHNNLARIMQNRGDFSGAILHYKKAMTSMPRDMLIPYNLANTYKDKEDFEQAAKYYKKSLEINPRFADAHNNLGLAYTNLGKTEKALEHYRKAVELKPEYVNATINIGNLFAQKKDFKEAIRYYEKALDIKANDENAHANLANVMAELGRYDEALKHYDKALAINPQNKIARINRELTLRRQKGVEQNFE